ncbi:primosomal protein N' [Pannus brasiliensis CCIBt3594]|uniref:Replication restart protein PriA n=1 Tax=Pannus brasiliensis CCIBt3594 TaxID=1427578 RepID=A0AAW9QKL6_9CHRO
MLDRSPTLAVAEPSTPYHLTESIDRYVEVLLDLPGSRPDGEDEQRFLTYRIPEGLPIRAGDILSVPIRSEVFGGIAIRTLDRLPETLDPARVRPVNRIIATGFFSDRYWELLQRVARYYATDLMTAIRIALPPGLLEQSLRRLRLKPGEIPPGAEELCPLNTRRVLKLLRSQSEGDYSIRHIKQQIKSGAAVDRGIKDLIKRGWAESYLEEPKTVKPELQLIVTLLIDHFPADLNEKQSKTLGILRQYGGELWKTDLIKLAETDSIRSLEKKGYVVVEERERLRLSSSIVPRDTAKSLTPAQSIALEKIQSLTGGQQALLHGVTGSGKTEIYLQAIAPILESGRSALVLVPEIGLTPQLTDRFAARFGDRVCVYHSALSDGERYDTWRQMLAGEAQVVIGTRSAVFAPLPRLGMIILDEEHDSSFKQTQRLPAYHARTVAEWRAELEDCPLLLGSATPSLESWLKAVENPDSYLSLPDRIQNRPLPPVEIVDMRRELQSGNRSLFSRSLRKSLENLRERGEQAILFVSRRGHSTFVSCRSCGYVAECPHCDVSLSYHYTRSGAAELLRCHYCNYSRLQPRSCPECSSPYFKFFGTGTQRVERDLSEEFPDLRCIRFDSDTTSRKNASRELLRQFASGEADVLVGTQMLTKGLDIDRVTLVGVMAADGLLYHSDYRAAERAFQTLTQVVGRAGRGEVPGRAIVQTYTPEHPVIRAVQTHDYEGFVEAELEQRETLFYPPHGRLILLRLSGLDGEEVQKSAEVLADACIEVLGTDCEILGPSPAMVQRVASRYRWQILLKFPAENRSIVERLQSLKSLVPRSVSLAIDVDPLTMD